MKLCRIGSVGKEKPVIIDSENNYRDLSSIINDLNPDTLNFDTLEKIKKTDISSLPKLDSSSRIGACVSNPVPAPIVVMLSASRYPNAYATSPPIRKETKIPSISEMTPLRPVAMNSCKRTPNAVATIAKSRNMLPPRSPMPASNGRSEIPRSPLVIIPPR